MIRFREVNINLEKIWRVFISGCSSAGKTYFAKRLLESQFFKCNRVYYFHPDIHESNPVDWDVIFQAGLPELEDLLNMPPYSCIILDDLYHECKDSKVIDYLFRVLSRKKNLHVIIMTQRYFSNGKYALNIRNSSNYHVLMRNADEHANTRAARTMGLSQEFKLANEITSRELYPYFFFDKTNNARANKLQLYIDIFAKFPKIVMKTGLNYLISANDFDKAFTKTESDIAYESPKSKSHQSSEYNSDGASKRTSKGNDSKIESFIKQKRYLKRRVEQIIRRHKKRSLI